MSDLTPVGSTPLTAANAVLLNPPMYTGYPPGSYASKLGNTGNSLDVPPGPVQLSVVKNYYCPSRHAPDIYNRGDGVRIGQLDYACAHPWDVPMPLQPNGEPWADCCAAALTWWDFEGHHGVIAPRRHGKVTFASVTDGTSNTLMIGEKFRDPSQYADGWGDGKRRGWVGGNYMNDARTTGIMTGDPPGTCPMSLTNPPRDLNLPPDNCPAARRSHYNHPYRSLAFFWSAPPPCMT